MRPSVLQKNVASFVKFIHNYPRFRKTDREESIRDISIKVKATTHQNIVKYSYGLYHKHVIIVSFSSKSLFVSTHRKMPLNNNGFQFFSQRPSIFVFVIVVVLVRQNDLKDQRLVRSHSPNWMGTSNLNGNFWRKLWFLTVFDANENEKNCMHRKRWFRNVPHIQQNTRRTFHEKFKFYEFLALVLDYNMSGAGQLSFSIHILKRERECCACHL